MVAQDFGNSDKMVERFAGKLVVVMMLMHKVAWSHGGFGLMTIVRRARN